MRGFVGRRIASLQALHEPSQMTRPHCLLNPSHAANIVRWFKASYKPQAESSFRGSAAAYATAGKPSWEDAPTCDTPQDRPVLDATGKLWGWSEEQSCAYRWVGTPGIEGLTTPGMKPKLSSVQLRGQELQLPHLVLQVASAHPGTDRNSERGRVAGPKRQVEGF